MEQEPPKPPPDQPAGDSPQQNRPRRKTARVVCASNKEFWTTQKQFWEWVREGIVTQTGDRPLTGKFEGRREKLLILVNHIVLDQAAPEHKGSVLQGYNYQKPRKLKRPIVLYKKRPR